MSILLLLLACQPGDDCPPGKHRDTAAPNGGDSSGNTNGGDSAWTNNGDSDGDSPGGTTDCVDDSGVCELVVEGPDSKDTGDGPRLAYTLTGSVTWSLDFDADAEALGFVDCDYTRTYDGVEITDQPYLCPDCTLLVSSTATMTEGYEDCYLQIDDGDQARPELIGTGLVDGADHFFRSGVENVSLGDMGELSGDVSSGYTVAWESESSLTDGGVMVLSATGSFSRSQSDSVMVDDITGARTEPYACGWPLNSPGGASPTFTVSTGAIFPNARLEDQCGEMVDLWDFRGYYLVIDASATDCGPCQAMAGDAEAFKARMEEACLPVELITILSESLSAVNQPADLATRQEWADYFGLTSPVLGDRGFGYALLPDYFGNTEGMSFPSIVVVDPEGYVLYGDEGYSSEITFDSIEDVIRAHAGR